jgi:hypothetical protein
MAKTQSRKSGTRAIVRVPTVRPLVIRQTKVVKQKKKHHRRHSSGLGGFLSQHQIKAAIGGAALGFIHKQFPTLPTVPMLGRNGTIALIAYMARGKVPFAEDVAIAALAISGYQFVATGSIEGGDYIAGQF